MHAIRAKERGMTKEQKAERKRKEKLQAQKNYRLGLRRFHGMNMTFSATVRVLNIIHREVSSLDSTLALGKLIVLFLFTDGTGETLLLAAESALPPAVHLPSTAGGEDKQASPYQHEGYEANTGRRKTGCPVHVAHDSQTWQPRRRYRLAKGFDWI
jgi:hypothetical protein